MSAVATERRPLDGRSRPGDNRSHTRLLAALVLPVGPVAVAVLRYVLPYYTASDARATARDVIAHEGRQSLVLWLGLLAALTLLPGVLAVGRLVRTRAPKLTAAAMMLVVPGYLALTYMLGTDIVLWTGAHAGMNVSSLARLADTVHPASDIAVGIFVIGHVLGTVLLGVALLRARVVPRVAAVATIVAQPLHFVALVVLGSPTVDLIAWVINGIAFAFVAVRIVRTPDDEWDLAPVTGS